jgi:16S rRNA C967 or C1407 C5-methylase (RsmB/RsmF family)
VDPKWPPWVRVSFPQVLFEQLCNEYGAEQAEEICLISNQVSSRNSCAVVVFLPRCQRFSRFYAFCVSISSLSASQMAPFTVRVNPLKISRDAFLHLCQKKYPNNVPRATERSPLGVVFPLKFSLMHTTEHKTGMCEVQDEGSQLVGLSVKAQPGEKVRR